MIIIQISDRYFDIEAHGLFGVRTLGMTRDTLRLYMSQWYQHNIEVADLLAEMLRRIDETGTSSKHYSRDQLLCWLNMAEDEIYEKYGDGR